MKEIYCDININRLFIKVIGSPDIKEMQEVFDEIKKCIEKLQPGFDVIHDLTEFVPVSPKTSNLIKEIQIFLDNSGLSNAVRIVDNPFSDIQLERTRHQANSKYLLNYAKDYEEATKILNSLTSKKSA